MKKKEVQGGALKNITLGWIFVSKTGGLEMQKQAFRIILLQNAMFRCFAKRHRNERQKGPNIISKIELWVLRGLIFEFEGGC